MSRAPRKATAAAVLALAAALAGGCGASPHPAAQGGPGAAGKPAAQGGPDTGTGPPTLGAGPLRAPATSPVQDAAYFTDLAHVDPQLATYVTDDGDTALRALLTDGTGFCAFLQRDGTIDDAMVSLAEGAQSVESQTHLPTGVTTYNAIDAVALVALCPSEQRLLPADTRSRITALSRQLGAPGSSARSTGGS